MKMCKSKDLILNTGKNDGIFDLWLIEPKDGFGSYAL